MYRGGGGGGGRGLKPGPSVVAPAGCQGRMQYHEGSRNPTGACSTMKDLVIGRGTVGGIADQDLASLVRARVLLICFIPNEVKNFSSTSVIRCLMRN